MSAIKPVEKKGLKLRLENTVFYITGNIDTLELNRIFENFIGKIHNYIIKNKIKLIKVNISSLEFLNSLGIKKLVDWILQMESLSGEQIYKIIFFYNSEIEWQESFVSSVVKLNPDYVLKEDI